MNRGTIAEIDLSSVSHNFRVVKGLTGNRPVIAVVKADAYGHGAVEVSKRLVQDGAEYLAVAFTNEARILREAGISIPIIVLFDPLPESKDVVACNLIPVVSNKKAAVALSKEAEKSNRRIHVHIKLDTGMGRLGIQGDAAEEIAVIAQLKGIQIDGVLSHFSEADLADISFARQQINQFKAVQDRLRERGISVKLFHMANSAAVLTLPDSHLKAVRPGLMLYGYSPLQKESGVSLLPVMTVKTAIISLRKMPPGVPISYGRTFITKRDSLIGVIAAGYADGFNRKFSNNAEVLVKGKRVPVVGRVCMDLTMVDLTEVGEVSEEDEVVIVGKQGGEVIDAAGLAARIDTIPYEVLIALGSKARRVYKPER